MGIRDDIGDPAFKAAQFHDADNLADSVDNRDPEYELGVQRVVRITGGNHRQIQAKLAMAETDFGVGSTNATQIPLFDLFTQFVSGLNVAENEYSYPMYRLHYSEKYHKSTFSKV